MNDFTHQPVAERISRLEPSDQIRHESSLMAERLSEFLKGALDDVASGHVAHHVSFLDHYSGFVPDANSPADGNSPFNRLLDGFGLSPLEKDLLVLAGLAEQHEGFGEVFSALHPQRLPYPTIGLAAQLFCGDDQERDRLRALVETGPVFRSGTLQIHGDGPFFVRHLRPADLLWSVLNGIDVWPEEINIEVSPIAVHGLEEWFNRLDNSDAITALSERSACTVLVTANDENVAFRRAASLLQIAGLTGIRIILPAEPANGLQQLIQPHAMARNTVPILRITYGDGPRRVRVPSFADYPGPIVICGRVGNMSIPRSLPCYEVFCEPMTTSSLREMWRRVLPQFAGDAATLAARFPVEPSFAAEVAGDLQHLMRVRQTRIEMSDVARCVRIRAGTMLSHGVKLIRPTADWDFLVLPVGRKARLREAVDRLLLQSKVLDDWSFLKGRHGARGVRMLFSGPPGTGKTLAAEVIAQTLSVDLLIVDLSRVVSKWIGESEKNLAEVFETAERAKAVLLFDEADALFGKRTEVSDAHDRYANLETAYLLSRLERYEGLAILSTNLRQNIDAAFTRRLEFLIPFDEPGLRERRALWQAHLPADAPLSSDVDLEELASLFPMTGGLIRNASVAAAFLAAAEDGPISQKHFNHAIASEYEKIGRPFPGTPTGLPNEEQMK